MEVFNYKTKVTSSFFAYLFGMCQRFIFWSLDHQALLTSLLAELPSHHQVGLNHSVKGVLQTRVAVHALFVYNKTRGSRIKRPCTAARVCNTPLTE